MAHLGVMIDRLGLLRKLMRGQKVPLDAYLVPTDDAHQVHVVGAAFFFC